MYQDLLLATDGSDGARQATEHAIELADGLGATLHIVSVSEDGPHSSEKQDAMRSDPEGEAAEALEEAERAAAQRDLEVTTTVRHGVPQEEIVDVAEVNAIDMIVVGTEGRTGLDHLVVGSVAEEIVRNAPVPVVTVRDQTA
ncbi:universal stress protein [Natronorubrum sp. DTA7]|uniref:universal stress protein n=1 Tax=Natronorubrum sp. DTA7 TaxID=3447016 RepID=UPI003F86C917